MNNKQSGSYNNEINKLSIPLLQLDRKSMNFGETGMKHYKTFLPNLRMQL